MFPRCLSILRIINGCSWFISGPTSLTGRISTCEPGKNAFIPPRSTVNPPFTLPTIEPVTGSSKIINRNSGGGSKLQGIPSSTNLNTWSHVAFRNRNVVCPCKREYIFCMNQLGGVGAGGIPGRSYAFAPGADGTHKHFYF